MFDRRIASVSVGPAPIVTSASEDFEFFLEIVIGQVTNLEMSLKLAHRVKHPEDDFNNKHMLPIASPSENSPTNSPIRSNLVDQDADKDHSKETSP